MEGGVCSLEVLLETKLRHSTINTKNMNNADERNFTTRMQNRSFLYIKKQPRKVNKK